MVVLISLYNILSISIESLRAYLKSEGIEVISIAFKTRAGRKIVSHRQEEIDFLVEKVLSFSPKIVGINVNSTLHNLAKKITDKIKLKNPKVCVVWGGVHPTIYPQECAQTADFLIRGEGEIAFGEFVKKYLQGKDIHSVNNLFYRKADQTIENPVYDLIDNLDNLPVLEHFNSDSFYIANQRIISLATPPKDKFAYHIMISRGCPFNCSYCCHSGLSKLYKRYYIRRRSPEHVILELKNIKKYPNINFVRFFDDIFYLPLPYLEKLKKLYTKEINLPFWCYLHPHYCTENYIKLLKEMGLKVVTVGIQSSNERIRKQFYNRKETDQEIIYLSSLLEKYRISAFYDIIANNPLEKDSDKQEGLKNLTIRLKGRFRIALFNMNYFPGTSFAEYLIKNKIISEKDLEHNRQEGKKVYGYTVYLNQDIKETKWQLIYILLANRYFPRSWLIFMSKINLYGLYYCALVFILFVKLVKYKLYKKIFGEEKNYWLKDASYRK